MNDEQREKLNNALMEKADIECAGDIEALRMYQESTLEDILKIEPLIDEMLKPAADEIRLSFHETVQLHAFVRFHEWREPRPGFVNCAECHVEFQATPIAARRHAARCRVGELIKILQAKIEEKRSKDHAISENTPGTRK